MNQQKNFVAFASKRLEKIFEKLNTGDSSEKQLHKFIDRAIEDLKKNPLCSIKIPKRLWPKDYVKKYELTNLWKYDLPGGWRLIYTIQTNEIMILSVILEWFNHKNYEKKFKY